MKILVTGGAGYIGAHTVWELYARGHDVVVLDDMSNGAASNLPLGVPMICTRVGDIYAFKSRLQMVDAIVHLAAKTSTVTSEHEAKPVWNCNVEQSEVLLDWALENGVKKLVFASSSAVYGDSRGNMRDEEYTPCTPSNFYGQTKVECERLLSQARLNWGLSYVALRYFNVAGADPTGRAGQCGAATPVIRAAVNAALNGSEFVLYGDKHPTPDRTAVRDFIHVSDVARVNAEAVSYLLQGGKVAVCNVGSGKPTSMRQVLDRTEQLLGKPIKVRVAGHRSGDVAGGYALLRSVLDLGVTQPYYELDDMIRHAAQWEMAQAAQVAKAG